MEEKKLKQLENEVQSAKKLTYEEVVNYAQSMAQQAEAMSKEITKLRAALDNVNRNNFYQELHFAFKVIELADHFSPEFVKKVSHKIESTVNTEEEEELDDNASKEG